MHKVHAMKHFVESTNHSTACLQALQHELRTVDWGAHEAIEMKRVARHFIELIKARTREIEIDPKGINSAAFNGAQ